MTKKKLMRIIAVCTACLTIGAFAFTGCKSGAESGTGGGNTTESGGKDDNTDGGKDDGKDDNTDDKKDEEIKDPVISGPVKGGPAITKASKGELEAAYVEWTAAENAKWYKVYYSEKGAGNWIKLDDPLVRQYKDYFRADAVGLKAGEYDMKVVPVSGDDTEATQFAATAQEITVKAHDRSGYAFTGGTFPARIISTAR